MGLGEILPRHGIGHLKPKAHFPYVACEKFADKIGGVRNLAQRCRDRFSDVGGVAVEGHYAK
jgi:hypothetical protein